MPGITLGAETQREKTATRVLEALAVCVTYVHACACASVFGR